MGHFKDVTMSAYVNRTCGSRVGNLVDYCYMDSLTHTRMDDMAQEESE
jgi:hypothetical protein